MSSTRCLCEDCSRNTWYQFVLRCRLVGGKTKHPSGTSLSLSLSHRTDPPWVWAYPSATWDACNAPDGDYVGPLIPESGTHVFKKVWIPELDVFRDSNYHCSWTGVLIWTSAFQTGWAFFPSQLYGLPSAASCRNYPKNNYVYRNVYCPISVHMAYCSSLPWLSLLLDIIQ